jgi:ABC-2 type transport system permease protein
MREFFHSIASLLIRISAFVSKELFTVLSQPRLLGVLILGPFLILLIFGISYRDVYRTLRTTVVFPEDSPVEPSVRAFAEQSIFGIEVTEITSNAAGALSALENRLVDLVLVIPPDPSQTFDENRQAVFSFYHTEIDPYEVTYVDYVAQRITEEVNRQLMLSAIEQSKTKARAYQAEIHQYPGFEEYARETDASEQTAQSDIPVPGIAAVMGLLFRDAGEWSDGSSNGSPGGTPSNPTDPGNLLESGAPELSTLDAQLSRFIETDARVIVEPFRRQTQTLNRAEIQPVHFYIPAVLALLLQHIAVSLAGLSIVTERYAGTMELMRAAPVNPLEVMLGKYLSFLIFLSLLAAALTALVVGILGVPLFGSLLTYALVIFLVILVSLGFGFLISTFARSDSQAIQFAMVLLLGSIFFTGFFLPLYRLWWPAQAISWAMPATYGLTMLQDIMLRGTQPETWLFWVLGGLALALFIINWFRLRTLMVQN